MKKPQKPRPISEAERNWMEERGEHGRRCFAYSSDMVPKNNVFSLAHHRHATQPISLPALDVDVEANE
jgi:hypothetical protein